MCFFSRGLWINSALLYIKGPLMLLRVLAIACVAMFIQRVGYPLIIGTDFDASYLSVVSDG